MEHLERIRHMEALYVLLSAADPRQVCQDPVLLAARDTLEGYLTGGLWLADYTLDEAGLLPPDLPRGVLSQDGLYDLLRRIDGAK